MQLSLCLHYFHYPFPIITSHIPMVPSCLPIIPLYIPMVPSRLPIIPIRITIVPSRLPIILSTFQSFPIVFQLFQSALQWFPVAFQLLFQNSDRSQSPPNYSSHISMTPSRLPVILSLFQLFPAAF